MKISEAMRLGSSLKPQIFGVVHGKIRHWFGFGGVEASCAWGAVEDAAGLRTIPCKPTKGNVLRGTGLSTQTVLTPPGWGLLLNGFSPCPACSIRDTGFRLIAHLNDFHRWERTRIADWVETVESDIEHFQQQQPRIETETTQ